MKAPQVISLALLIAVCPVGVGVLAAHIDGLIYLNETMLLILCAAVVAILLLLGFFLGVFYVSRDRSIRSLKSTSIKLKEVLGIERAQRIELAKERYELRKNIVALEGKIKDLCPDGSLPPARNVETQTGDDGPVKSAGLEELAATCERMRFELTSRKERMVDLQAELSIAQAEVMEARQEAEVMRSVSSIPPPKAEPDFYGESLTEVLDGIVSLDGISMAMVADDQGLVVDTAGELLEPDTLAAVSGLVSDLSPRVTELLPIDEIHTVALGDMHGRVMEVRYFELFDARCALLIIRDEAASHPGIARTAVEAISARLNS
jgi:predicted regulator of Ras-like GTPase activity (Roadblock/LC7/MglB family)